MYLYYMFIVISTIQITLQRQLIVDPDETSEGIPENYEKYKTLTQALNAIQETGGFVFLKEGSSHFLDSNIYVLGLIEIKTNISGADSKAGITMKGCRLTVCSSGILVLGNILIRQEGVDEESNMKDLIHIETDGSLFLRNMIISHLDALNLENFIFASAAYKIKAEEIQFIKITNKFISSIFRIEKMVNISEFFNISFTSDRLDSCRIFFIVGVLNMSIIGLNIENSWLMGAVDITGGESVTLQNISMTGNIFLATAVKIYQMKGPSTLNNFSFIKNSRRSDTDLVPFVLDFKESADSFYGMLIKILDNHIEDSVNFVRFINCIDRVFLFLFEISDNIYSQDAVVFSKCMLTHVENFNCNSNNLNSNSGGACIFSEDVAQSIFINLDITSNFARSKTCGLIFIQSDNFNTEIFPHKKQNASIIVYRSLFSENEVRAQESLFSYSGTAIFLFHEGLIILEETKFLLNTHYYQKNLKNIQGSPCLDSFSEYNSLFIRHSTFKSNKATAGSNCISFRGNFLNLSESLFDSNQDYSVDVRSYNYEPFTFGAAIFIETDACFLVSVSFRGNQAKRGGSLGFSVRHEYLLQKLEAINLTFDKNTGSDKGGVVFLQDYDKMSLLNIRFINCTFSDNRATKEGGVFYNHGLLVENTIINIINCKFFRNSGSRGAVFFNAILNYNTKIENTTFSYNAALSTTDGGAVFYNDDNHDLIMINCIFSHNTAVMRGGVIQLMKGKFMDSGSTYINNSAGYVGGVFILHRVSEVHLYGSYLKESSSLVNGGTCFIMQSTVFIMKNVLIDQGVSQRGGAITIMQEAYLEINNTIFKNCRSNLGTIIYSVNTLSTILLSNIEVYENSVGEIALFYLLFSNMNVSSMIIRKNNGSIFNLKDVDLVLQNITVIEQNCDKMNIDGCILNGDSSNIAVSSSLFTSVKMSGRSIGFSLLSCTFLLSISQLSNLTGMRSPSILRAVNVYDMAINDCSFMNFYRQAIYISDSAIAFKGNLIDMFLTAVVKSDNFLEEGFLYCRNCLKSNFQNNIFKNLLSKEGSALYFTRSKGVALSPNITLKNNEFSDNSAKLNGGAIYSFDQNVILEGNLFRNNRGFTGGAVFLNCSSENDFCQWSISSCIFINNHADESGGAIYWSNKKPEGGLNLFENNTAKHGPNQASKPIKIASVNTSYGNLVSGQPLNVSLEFEILDAYNQLCTALSSGQAFIEFNTYEIREEYPQVIVGTEFFKIEGGKFRVEKLTLISKPGIEANFLLRTTVIGSYSKYVNYQIIQEGNHKSYFSSYYYSLNLPFRHCKRGEIYKAKDNVCALCSAGSYSFDSANEKCFDCPNNAYCVGSDILALPGYWKGNENSTELYECNILQQACPGGKQISICNPGFTGPLCATCTYNNEEQYFKNAFRVCKSCSEGQSPLSIIATFITFAVLVVIIIFTIKTSFNLEKQYNQSLLTILKCILVNYLQILSLLTNINIKWPKLIESSSQVINFAGDIDRIVGIFECPLSEMGLRINVTVYTVKMVAGTIFFVFSFLFTFAFWWVYSFMKKIDVKDKILISLISIYLLTLQPMIKFYTNNFNCITIYEKAYLKEFPLLECNTDEHLKLLQRLILPAFFLIVVFPPTLMLLYLIQNRDKLDSKEIKQKAFVIVNPYKKRYFFWEFCILIRKFALIFSSIFLNKTPVVSCLVVIIIIFVSCSFQIKLQPFKNHDFNKLEMIQNFAIYATFSTALFFSYTEIETGIFILYIILFASNGYFLMVWLSLYLTIYAKTKNLSLKSISNKISIFKERFSTKKKSELKASKTKTKEV